MKLWITTAVVVLGTASAAFAAQNASTPMKATHHTAKHSSTGKNASENQITAQLNQQQLQDRGAQTATSPSR